MAGTFTHWMIVEQSLDQFNKLPKKPKLFSTILGNNQMVLLGGVSPDYPYLSELKAGLLKIHSWADRMHYENTGELVKFGVQKLSQLKGSDFDICLAWLSGYVTHLIADAVVHPIVNSIVGPYIFNATEHRHCEMTQDSYIFKEIKKVEIEYSEFADLIKQCSVSGNPKKLLPSLKDFWTDILEKSHPGGKDKFDKIDPDRWHEEFLSKISLASDPIPVFRHFGEEKNLVYKKTTEITPQEKMRFVDSVTLPNGNAAQFKKKVFDKAVAQVIKVWEKLLVDIENQMPMDGLSYIKNWNLDSGVDEDRRFFWS